MEVQVVRASSMAKAEISGNQEDLHRLSTGNPSQRWASSGPATMVQRAKAAEIEEA
jgi:hypothetical protein